MGEYDSIGNLVARYDYGFGLLSRMNGAGASVWYMFDALGSTSELTDTAGVVANDYVYAPFGEVLKQTISVPNPFQFVGAWGVMDEGNGLNVMRARYYAPVTGRFMQANPIGVAGGVDLYGYVGNVPTQFMDSTGLCRNLSDEWEEALRARDRNSMDLDLRDREHYLWTAGQVQEAGKHGSAWQTLVSAYWMLMTIGYSDLKA